MSRLIINNKTDLSDAEVLTYIEKAIEQGKISNDGQQYSYVTSWDDGVVVMSGVLKNGYKFTVLRNESGDSEKCVI